MPTADEVAEFMVEQVLALGHVTHGQMVEFVAMRFGDSTEVDHIIQGKFRRLAAGRVRWVGHGEYWEVID